MIILLTNYIICSIFDHNDKVTTVHNTIGTLSFNSDGSNKNVTKQLLISKTQDLHAPYSLWYVSLLSTVNQQHVMTKFEVYRGGMFPFLFLNLNATLMNLAPQEFCCILQIHPLSPNSDQHQISPCNTNAYSTPEVMKIKKLRI